MQRLRRLIENINGKGYREYKKLRGSYNFNDFALHIDHVQGDPFAAPSRIRIEMKRHIAGYPEEFLKNEERRTATCDFILRKVYRHLARISDKMGSGKSGIMSILRPSHVVLKQSAVVFTTESLEIRFFVGLPAYGRKIAGREAKEIFFKKIPELVSRAILFKQSEFGYLKKHVELKEDQVFLRNKLKDLNLVSFIKDGSILPRETGVSNRPLKNAVLFKSPDALRVTINLPNAGTITGMGIREGITLITGGGYHGKSTLLRAILEGIYDHVIGDGREYVITIKRAHYIRAEDRRRIEKVNIKPFIDNLPQNIDTSVFSTDNASGSTSQAANIQEAIEMGAELLLIDEDTSATNFMTRDRRMQELISKDREPITPFIDRAREIYKNMGVSTILVVGGIGDYLDIADTCIQMDTFIPKDVTKKARKVVEMFPSHRKNETVKSPYVFTPRVPDPSSINPQKGKREFKIDAPRKGIITFGINEIDLSLIEEFLSREQTRSAGYAILYLLKNKIIDGRTTFSEIVNTIERLHPDSFSPYPYPMGELCEIRGEEVVKALNRLRTLRVYQKP